MLVTNFIKFFNKKIIFLIIGLVMIVPIGVSAAEVAPEYNTLCWKEEQCNKLRAEILDIDDANKLKGDGGWFREVPCTGDWGKCLPAGQITTTIAFGGKTSFTNIGEFIKYNYGLALSIASILAVIMIIVAGVQWVTSSGNSEMITSAKKRIGGAVIGLLIAYLSYVILNTINPATVNLRLPQTFLIRPLDVIPQFCKQAEATEFAFASAKGQPVVKDTSKSPEMKVINKNTMKCGDNYFVKNGGGATCWGSACSTAGQMCLPITLNDDGSMKNEPNCDTAQLIVHFYFNLNFSQLIEEKIPLLADINEPNWLDEGEFFINSVCQDTTTGKIYSGRQYNWVNNVKVISIKQGQFWEYYVKFNALHPNKPTPVSKEQWCDVAEIKGAGNILLGFNLIPQIDIHLNINDAYFSVSPKETSMWKSISENGYVDIAFLEKGEILQAEIESSDFNDIQDNKGAEPGEFYIDGNDSNKRIISNVIKPGEINTLITPSMSK